MASVLAKADIFPDNSTLAAFSWYYVGCVFPG
jgi:hypothetical protein